MKEQKTSHHQGFSDLAFRITVQLTVLLPAIGFVAAIAAVMPKFRNYDVRTNEFAVQQAKIRQNQEKI